MRANASIALGVYGADPNGHAATESALSVLLADSDGVAAITSFMNPGLFRYFDVLLSL
jgi:hypothetical protein